MPIMRLDKFFSSQELFSRKDIKTFVKKGNIKINTTVAKSHEEKIDTDKDTIYLNNEEVAYKPYVYIMLNKPQGVVSASNSKSHKTVLDLVPQTLFRSDLFPAGRLDKDTEGFVLITNDGDFAHHILSPKNHIEKKYIAILDGKITSEGIAQIEAGITLADGTVCQKAKLTLLEDSDTPSVEVSICEGKYHQIKRMFGVLGLGVNYLKRTQMGHLPLDPKLGISECREILHKEIQEI
ncbi:MAG: pseudouridine synthase, partial [Oscillospiraceae bacterium]